MAYGRVIGFIGNRRSGKSSCSQTLRRIAGSSERADIEFSDPIIEAANYALEFGDLRPSQFGNALVEGARVVTGKDIPGAPYTWRFRQGPGIDVEFRLRHWLESEVTSGLRLTRLNKDRHRAVLMWLGINIRDLMLPSIWADEIERRIDQAASEPLVTVAGVRFPVDVLPVRSRNGYVIEVRSARAALDDDPTNAFGHTIGADTIVHNDSSLESLNALMERFYRDMVNNRLAASYKLP